MLPSRGLHLRRLRLPNGTSPSRPTPSRFLSTSRPITSRLYSPIRSQWRATRHSPVLAVSSMRFASTAPTTSPSPALPADAPTDTPNLDTITFDTLDFDPSSATEGIGYLASLGPELQYWSWGPTTLLQNIIEVAHFHVGLPWWGAILATSFFVRAVALPLAVKMQDAQARTSAMAPVLQPKLKEYRRLMAAGDTMGLQRLSQEMRIMRAQSGAKQWPMFAYLGAQTVIGICGFRLTRAMANLPVPGLDQGGFLWLSDLTVSDPFLIMPAVLGLIMHLLFRFGGETGNNALMNNPQIRTAFLYVLPAITAVTVGFQPGTTVLFLTVATAMGVAQTLTLRSPPIRKALGVAPTYKPPPGQEIDPFAMFKTSSKDSANGGARSSLHYQPPGRTINVKATSTPSAPATPSDVWGLIKAFRSSKTPLEDPKEKAAQAYEQRINAHSRSGKK